MLEMYTFFAVHILCIFILYDSQYKFNKSAKYASFGKLFANIGIKIPLHEEIIRMNTIPRPEYPRPQMVRQNWINLNGSWEFEIDQSVSGKE